MKGKKQLEIFMEGLEKKKSYVNFLEQYPTDSSAAAYVLALAHNDGNISGKKILDLGTGNGIFACGAMALGASSVLGIDIDQDQVDIARRNCSEEGAVFEAVPVESVSGVYDTVIMNPPFGSVNEHSDVPFLEKAIESGEFIYSIHNAKSADFIRNFYSSRAEIFREEPLNIEVGRLYKHHRKDRATIRAVFFSVRVSR